MKPQILETVVPWRNPEQFCKVYKCLYSKSISDKRWAVDQISVWESRCHPSLPKAVEASVTLVRAVIQDLLSEVDKSFCQTTDIQMMYCTAIIRFVNLIVESDQSTAKLGVTGMAEKKNVPNWIVDLRHQAVHSFCPSLPVLRMGTDNCLEYLEEHYWKAKAASTWPVVKTPSMDEQKIFDLLIQYKNIQHQRREKKLKASDLRNDLYTVLKSLRTFIDTQGQLVLDCLTKPGVFLSADDVVKILQYSAPLYLEFDTDLPEQLEQFWLPLLRILHYFNLIPNFIERLMLSLENCKVHICQKVAAAWVIRILRANSTYKSEAAFDICFKRKGAHFNFYRLLYAAMRGANMFMVPVLHLIISKVGNAGRFKQMFCILALNQGWLADNKPAETRRLGPRPASKRARDAAMQEIIFSLEDVEEDLNELKSRRKRMRKDDNIWSLAPVGMDWTQTPMGAILHPASEAEDKNGSPKTEPKQEFLNEEPTHFIICNENDNEEITAEETVTPDIRRETYIPEMLYRRRQ